MDALVYMEACAEDDEKRKAELDRFIEGMRRTYRAGLVEVARGIARRMATENGSVTSTQVLDALRADPDWSLRVAEVDARFMGLVFRSEREWKRVGWSPDGSHSRPVSVWELRT
jgi:hypothetical protein